MKKSRKNKTHYEFFERWKELTLEEYSERLYVKITPSMKLAIREYVRQENKELENYSISDFLREAIHFRLVMDKQKGLKDDPVETVLRIVMATRFLENVFANIDMDKTPQEAILIFLKEIMIRDKVYLRFRKKIIRKSENIIIKEAIKWLKKQEELPIELKKQTLIKLQKILRDE